MFREALEGSWYGNQSLGWVLAPLGWVYRGVVGLRRGAYAVGLMKTHRLPVPLIVVGNITVGGTGKSPLVIWLAKLFREHGYHPGVISRGYGGRAERWPQPVHADSDPGWVGDESVMIAQGCRCPVMVGPDRVEAAMALLCEHRCDVIVSDDGLQHLRLGRDVEIAVVDGLRRQGNGRCLPAGPLREPVSRLAAVDLVVVQGAAERGEIPMRYHMQRPRCLVDPERVLSFGSLKDTEVHAVAGIGHPARFFAGLRVLGIRVIEHAFPDHHRYSPQDLAFDDPLPVLMTEKDAVKCRSFAAHGHWYVPIEVELPAVFERELLGLLHRKCNGQKAA